MSDVPTFGYIRIDPCVQSDSGGLLWLFNTTPELAIFVDQVHLAASQRCSIINRLTAEQKKRIDEHFRRSYTIQRKRGAHISTNQGLQQEREFS